MTPEGPEKTNGQEKTQTKKARLTKKGLSDRTKTGAELVAYAGLRPAPRSGPRGRGSWRGLTGTRYPPRSAARS